MTLTPQQIDALTNMGFEENQDVHGEWIGKTFVVPFETRHALINEHGSVTYCEDAMLEAHKAGAR